MRLFDESAPACTGVSARSRAATRLSLGASPAVLAAMLALQPQAVQAQAFQGTETVILGNVTRVTSANSDFFTVNALQNTINWVPTDTAAGTAPINFLPTGATASFSGGSGTNGANYTVLNRIIAADQSRAIQFAGTVSSDNAGRIWFYAPGGLLLTGKSRFDVGSLLLTANDPVGAAAGLPYLDAANRFRLQAAATSTAAINVQAGAQINAVNSGSYVIAVAPRFAHAGAITVNGSAALAAVSDASFTLNGGLFDITANVGSGAGGTSSVTGSITGPAGNSAEGIYNRVYLMAVPRNDAMTLLITGGAQIGFAVAAAADVDGNAIVLSGGYDIRGAAFGSGLGQFGTTPVAGSNGVATISVDAAAFTSNVTMRSKNMVQAIAQTGSLTAARNLEVFADSQAIVRAEAGNSLLVAGNLSADASTYLTAGNGANRTAGTAEVSALSGGTVQVQNVIRVQARGSGDNASGTGQAGGTGTGGTASVNVLGGTMRAAGVLLDARGTAGAAVAGTGGSGVGGTAIMQVDAAGALVTQSINISAVGVGRIGESGQLSGNAQGGTARLNLNGTALTLPGSIFVVADAYYGERGPTAHQGGGQAVGGTAILNVGNGTVLNADQVRLSADASAVAVSGNNIFRGGTADLVVTDVGGATSVTAQSAISVTARARASDGAVNGNTAGGAAVGGFARLVTTGNPFVSVAKGSANIAADAHAGHGAGGAGGAALGGRAYLDMQNGGSLLISGNVEIDASTYGGDGTIGGSATGRDNGDANPPAVFLRLGPNVRAADRGIQIGGGLFLDAFADGGDGTTGVGGSARGGFVVLRGQSGTISANSVGLLADAVGGNGVGGGAARSGRLFGHFENANLTTTGLTLNVDAAGGSATDGGRGGDATVGQVFFLLSSLESGPGTTVNAGAATLLASAQGGAGGGSSLVAGDGGNAFGIDPNATGLQIAIISRPARSSFIASQFLVDNTATGGAGGIGLGTANGGRGGNALGGLINIGTTSGSVTPVSNRSSFDFGSLYFVDSRVTGGDGGGIDGDGLGGRGGNAVGGSATLLARGGLVTAGAVSIDTSAFGGNGGNGNDDLGGGNATGGQSLILATPHFTAGLPVDVAITGPVMLTANGQGGSSRGVAGIGQGGAAYVRLQRHEAAGAAPVTVVGSLFIDGPLVADAIGLGGTALGFGATGGAGIGGAVDLIAEGGSFDLRGGALLTATGTGASGFTGNTGLSGGAGGAATGGTAAVTVRPGGILTMPNLAVDVSAQAGLGGDGGTGQSGAPPGMPLPGQRDGNPGGDGLLGGNGGAGGAARGGNITIGTNAANSGGSITISSWSLRGEALAGSGGTGGTGGAGADGAAGLDGDAIFINGGNGGAGGNGGLAGNAGAGGSAVGGSLLIGAASNDLGTPWSLSVPLITANMQVMAGGSGSGGQGGTPGLGGAGGAAGVIPGPPPVNGKPGQAGANGFFGGQGAVSVPGLAGGATLQVLLFNANLRAEGIDLSADASGTESAFGGQAGDAQAGSAELVISGGTTLLGHIRLSAIGSGGQSLSGTAGSGRGGSVIFRVLGGADVTLGDRSAPLLMIADGYGGDGFEGALAGSGFGGSIVTQVNNARLQVNGDFLMAAAAFTGNSDDFASAVAGTIDLRFEDASIVGVANQLVLAANATGSIANGGQVAINGLGTGSLTVNGGVDLEARATMRQGLPGEPTTGGSIQINTQDGNSIKIGGNLTANAEAFSLAQVFGARMDGGSIAWNHRGTATVGGAVALIASATFGEGAGGNASGGDVLLSARSGSLSFGDLSMWADADAGFVPGGQVPAALGGTVTLNTDAGATLAAKGFVSLAANARGSFNNDGVGGNAQGGNINISSAGSLTMDIANGDLLIEAIGFGGSSNIDAGGIGAGGVAIISVAAGGDFTISGQTQSPLDVLIFGVGGSSPVQGGSGFGGNITLTSAGTLSVPSGLTLDAGGNGGTGGAGAVSGNGSGGAIDVVIGGGLSSFAGDLVLDVNASVPGGTVQGDGDGGSAQVTVTGGTLDVAGSLIVRANGAGTRNEGGAIGITASGGLFNVGNSVDLQAHSVNSTLSADAVIDAGDITVTVGAAGELRVLRFLSIDTFATGTSPLFNTTAFGGTIAISSAGTVALGGLRADASAIWQSPMQEGGASVGGSATLDVTGGSFTTTELLLTASAIGGNNPGGAAGAATGGFARLLTTGNPFLSVTSGSVEIAASARAGQSQFGAGGEALGGRAHLDMQNGGTLLVAGSLTLDAFTRAGDGATGGNATAFDNGDANPPAVLLRLGAGSGPGDQGIRVGANLILDGRASAGNSTDGIGGTARGGLLSLVVDSGNVSAQRLFMGASAIGGAGNIGGNARSGRMFQRISNGNMTVFGNAEFEFDAIAGNAVFGTGSRGGEAIIGQSVFTMSSLEAGPGASFTAANLVIVARAVGGAGGSSAIGGGAGGNAFGSDPNGTNPSLVIGIQPARSAFTVGQLIVDNSVRGGAGGEGQAGSNGGAGGTATRGFTSIGVISGPVTPTTTQSTAIFGDVTIFARNIGGDGGSASLGGLGGRGGNAVGGTALVLSRGGIVTANSVQIDVAGEGGSAGSAVAGDLGAGNGTGGTGGLLATPHFTAALPGQMTIAGAVTVNASGAGGNAITRGGVGRGGTARIELKRHEAPGAAVAAVSGALVIGGNVQLDSSARGGNGIGTGNGGNGIGGTSLLFTQAGTSLLSSNTDLLSIGSGGGQGRNGLLTGSGTGGEVQVTLDGGSMTISGNLFATARGQFGKTEAGRIRLTTTAAGGSLLLDGGNVTLMANAISGDGFEFGPGQNAEGGGVVITAGAGSLLRLRRPGAVGALTITVDAEVRNINQFSTSNAFGGAITITANGRLEMYGGATDLTLSATTRAGAGGTVLHGGEARGGGIRVTANTGGSILVDTEGQVFRLVANNFGGDSRLRPGDGGGSGITVEAEGGTITTTGAIAIEQDDFAGIGAPGGTGQGSGTRVEFNSGGTLAFGGPLSITGRGRGTNALGLAVRIESVGGGTMSVAGDINLTLDAFSDVEANSREVYGGSLRLATADSSVMSVVGGINVSANALVFGLGDLIEAGGGGMTWQHRGTATIQGAINVSARAEYAQGESGLAGLAEGGDVLISANSGVLTTGGLDFSATANAGFASNGVPSGATGGRLEIGTIAGAEFNINGGVFFDTEAVGSSATGGVGGDGRGGEIRITNRGIMRLNMGDSTLALQATGFGGDSFGGQGGVGRGGDIQVINVAGGSLRLTTTAFGVRMRAGGRGGDGINGGRGGGAAGGIVIVANAGILDIPLGLDLTADARSGDGLGAGDAVGGSSALLSQTVSSACAVN